MKKQWICKIGFVEDKLLPPGSDFPLRMAVRKAFADLTDRSDDFCSSGWCEEGEELS